MTNSSDRDETRRLLSRLGVSPDKAYGQNFLIDPGAIDAITLFGKPHSNEHLVEIGGGLGALTRELAAIAPLTVIELEPQFCRFLQKEIPSAQIIESDIRFFNLEELGSDLVVFGNLPYSFSSEILFYLISFSSVIRRAVLLLQREFAERVASPPGNRVYGALSVRAQLHANVRLGPIFPGDAFFPPASVESRLLELRFLKEPRYHVADPLTFQQLVTAAFSSRRRKLVNSIVASNFLEEAPLLKILESCGIDQTARAEVLSVEQFVALANSIAILNRNVRIWDVLPPRIDIAPGPLRQGFVAPLTIWPSEALAKWAGGSASGRCPFTWYQRPCEPRDLVNLDIIEEICTDSNTSQVLWFYVAPNPEYRENLLANSARIFRQHGGPDFELLAQAFERGDCQRDLVFDEMQVIRSERARANE